MKTNTLQFISIQRLCANKLAEIGDGLGLTDDFKLTLIVRSDAFQDGYLVVSDDELSKALEPIQRAMLKPGNGEVPPPPEVN